MEVLFAALAGKVWYVRKVQCRGFIEKEEGAVIVIVIVWETKVPVMSNALSSQILE